MRTLACGLLLTLAAAAWGADPATELGELRQREESPAFRRGVVALQVLRESYENWQTLPACQTLAQVVQGYQDLADRTAEDRPEVAAAAWDRLLQLGAAQQPQELMLARLATLSIPAAVRQHMATFSDPPPDHSAANGRLEVRALSLGPLEDGTTVVRLAFEVRSLSGEPERLALDLRVMHPEGNAQSQGEFAVPAEGWRRYDTSLGELFAAVGYTDNYHRRPGPSLVRASFSTVPASYPDKVPYEVALEHQFHRWYWVRDGLQ